MINTNLIEQWVKIVVFILLATAAMMYALAQSKSATSGASFASEGDATVSIAPDVATFTAGVVTEGKDAATVTDENNKLVNAVTEYVLAQGVAKEDVKTSSYSLYPDYDWVCDANDSCTDELSGYTMTQLIEIKVRDFTILGTILAGVVEKGANDVSGPWFELENQDSVEQLAREEAFEEARKKAKEIAEAGGFKLGRIIDIYEWTDGGDYGYTASYDSMLRSEETITAPDIQAGDKEVTVNVTVTYEIK